MWNANTRTVLLGQNSFTHWHIIYPGCANLDDDQSSLRFYTLIVFRGEGGGRGSEKKRFIRNFQCFTNLKIRRFARFAESRIRILIFAHTESESRIRILNLQLKLESRISNPNLNICVPTPNPNLESESKEWPESCQSEPKDSICGLFRMFKRINHNLIFFSSQNEKIN